MTTSSLTLCILPLQGTRRRTLAANFTDLKETKVSMDVLYDHGSFEHHHPQFVQPSFQISPPQQVEDSPKLSETRFIRKRPPIPQPLHDNTAYYKSQKEKSNYEFNIQFQVKNKQYASSHIHCRNAGITVKPSIPSSASPVAQTRAKTPVMQRKLQYANKAAYNRKGSLNIDMPPRPRKYSSPPSIVVSSEKSNDRPVPSKRRYIPSPAPPPLPPRIPLSISNSCSSPCDFFAPLEKIPPVPPKPVILRDHLSKSESELRYLTEVLFKESRSRHNSFNYPPPLPTKAVVRQPLPVKRRSTISLEEKSVFDREFDMLADVPTRRGTTGAESILRARYEEKKPGCCTLWCRDCIVDTPEYIMDICC